MVNARLPSRLYNSGLLLVLAGTLQLLPSTLAGQTAQTPAQSDTTAESKLPAEIQTRLNKLNDVLQIFRTVGDRDNEAITLNNIGGVYSSLGEKQKALDYYKQALPILHTVGDRASEAITLNNIGTVYDLMGEKQKALDYFIQALPIYRAVGDRGGEAITLNNIGNVHSDLGEKQKALDYYNQALPIAPSGGRPRRRGHHAEQHRLVYDDLGEKQKALDFYNQALPIHRAVGDRDGEADDAEQYRRCLFRSGREAEGAGLLQPGAADLASGGRPRRRGRYAEQHRLALQIWASSRRRWTIYNQALPIRRAVGDRDGEAGTLNNIGLVYELWARSRRRWTITTRRCRSSRRWATAPARPRR